MKWWQRLADYLDPAATEPPPAFTLGDLGQRPPEETAEVRRRLREAGQAAGALSTRVDRYVNALGEIPQEPAGSNRIQSALKAVGDLSYSLDENLDRLRHLFRAPDNADLIIRTVQVATHPPLRVAVIFMEGMVDRDIINSHILQPLMLLAHLDHHQQGLLTAPSTLGDLDGTASPRKRESPRGRGSSPQEREKPRQHEAGDPLAVILQRLLPGNQAETKPDMKGIVESVLYGDTAVFVEGAAQAIVVETKGFPIRSVSTPQQEMVIRGPLDAFTEAFRVNVALVRKRIKDPRLVTEILRVGSLSRTFVALLYVDGVANPKLVKEAKRRIENLEVDYVGESGVLEQLVEDRPFALFPQTLYTERPDRAAAYLTEGHVVAMVDNTPFALVVPTTFWSQLQSPEDYYVRWPFGTLLRWLRFMALVVATLTGALYIAAVNYHHEMIPTELMLSMAANRELVPAPAGVSLLAMEGAFELIREAGVRIPSVIGPTIGIVGALILGEALVAARLANPVVIIIVAVSGLASFVVPNYSTAYGVRLLRFVFIFLALTLGLYGIAIGLFAVALHLTSLRSFGVPYLTPVAPHVSSSPDIFGRGPLWDMEFRPRSVRPVAARRQDTISRKWDNRVPRALRRQAEEEGENGS